MDLLTLVYYFTVFPNDGVLKQLHIISSSETDFINTPQSHTDEEKHIFDRKYVQLVNKILNDRKSGVNQFGLESNLNIYQHNYAVKTGTSRDYHDSWTVGYTPDFVVGVWIGNDENTSLKQVSGQAGAGRIWHEIMELLLTTEYNKNTQFDFSEVSEEYINNSIEFGIKGDTNIDEYRNAMSDDILITHPHDRDIFEFSTTTVIPFKAQRDADWYVNGVIMGHGKVIDFKPDTSGTFDIEAIDKNGDSNNREIILIEVVGE
jgi:membrane peptidoglycan carboxypeptidase